MSYVNVVFGIDKASDAPDIFTVLLILHRLFIIKEVADTEGEAIAPVDDIICVGEAVEPTFRLLLIYTRGATA